MTALRKVVSMPVYHTAAGSVETLEWGDGPELFVLLHAAAAGPQSLAALATMLLRPGRRVIVPALHGYGMTVMLATPDRVKANLDVLRVCLATHAAERRVVFGHSMGGLIGLLGALDGLPLDGIVLYEPIVTACLRPDVPQEAALRDWDRSIVNQVERCLTDGNTESGVAIFINAWNETPWGELPPAVRARLIASAEALRADVRSVSDHLVPIDHLARLRMPVLLLQGTLSPPITHAITARLASLLPHAQHHTVAGCAHMGPILMPAAIHQAVAASLPTGQSHCNEVPEHNRA
jgi:pimeloyl-ACP methyl ester carboxylesterase